MRSDFIPEASSKSSITSLAKGRSKNPIWFQLSIYAHLLPLWRPGCHFRGILEYYLPEFMEVNISQHELAGIYDGLVVPILHEMFAARPEGTVTGPALSSTLPTEKHSTIERNIVTAFGAFGLSVEALGTIKGPQ